MANIELWVGGYGLNKLSGVNRIRFDGGFHEAFLQLKVKNPSYLEFANTQRLFFLEELEAEESSVGVFDTKHKTILFKTKVCGSSPCNMYFDGEYLFVANYQSGNVVRYYYKNDILTYSMMIQHEGVGKCQQRQRGPHAHCVAYSTRGILGADLGNDSLYLYSSTSSVFKVNQKVKVPSGYGPRLIAEYFDYVFVVCELVNKILQYAWVNDTLQFVSATDTLNVAFAQENYPAHIEKHPKLPMLYVSNRGHNSISVYAFIAGKLEFMQNHSCGGDFPRHFSIDPTGKYLFCANQKSNTISALSLYDNGKINTIVDSIEITQPTFVGVLP